MAKSKEPKRPRRLEVLWDAPVVRWEDRGDGWMVGYTEDGHAVQFISQRAIASLKKLLPEKDA